MQALKMKRKNDLKLLKTEERCQIFYLLEKCQKSYHLKHSAELPTSKYIIITLKLNTLHI